MARVIGPLLSMDASGAVGGSVVFSKWKGRNYVRRFVVPHNPRSALQVAQRAMLKFLAEAWSGFTIGNKATWDSLAAATNISPFNAYVSNNLNRHAQLNAPSVEYPETLAGVAPSAPTLVITGGVHNASVAITQGANAPDFGYYVYRKLGAAPSGLLSELIAVIEYDAAVTYYSDSPLTAGTYHYKAVGFLKTALKGTLSADANGIVT